MIRSFPFGPLPTALAVLSLLATGCTVSTIPKVTNIEQTIPSPEPSVIAVQAQFPLSKIQDVIEAQLPKSDRFRGKVNGGCKAEVDLGPIGFKLKVGDIKWEAHYTRSNFRVFNAGNDKIGLQAKFTLGAKVTCVVEFLNKKVFDVQESTDPDGILDLIVTVGASMGPLYNVQSKFAHNCCNWDRKPAIKLFELIKVTIEDITTDGLKKALDDASHDMQNKFNGIDVRDKSQKLWDALHNPVIIDKKTSTWLASRPLSLHSSGVRTTDKYAQIVIAARSILRVTEGEKPASSDLVALPILKTNVPSDKFQLSLPIVVRYPSLEDLLVNQLGGKTIEVKEGTLTMEKFQVYQSENKLAVGIGFVAKPKYFLPINGLLYFSGTPTVDPSTQILEFPDLDYAGNFDNPVVYILDWIFHSEFKEKLRQTAKIDLNAQVEKWKEKLAEIGPIEIAPGIKMEGKLHEFKLDYVIPNAEELASRVRAIGELIVETDLKVP